MPEQQPENREARLTRRQTLEIAGAAGSAVALGGGTAKLLTEGRPGVPLKLKIRVNPKAFPAAV
jgi:hypothetical protein